MSKLEVEFAFDIGDVVYFKTARHGLLETPNPYTVVEQIAQRCPGGVQLHYRLAPAPANMEPSMNEIVLTKEMPPYKKENPERRAEEREILEEKQASSKIHLDAILGRETE